MADKLTQQISDALTKAAAEPGGLPLYASKSDPGLFASTSVGKSSAQKCLQDGFVHVVGSINRGKNPRELYGLTEKGWNFLLVQVNPKQVLEDFVRVLEARSGEVGELLETARRMADNLQGLKDAVTRILPTVMQGRVLREVADTSSTVRQQGSFSSVGIASHEINGDRAGQEASFDTLTSTAILDAQPVEKSVDLATAIVNHLGDWSGTAGEDCPLPKLFQALSVCEPQPTIGEFHDSLRRLYDEGTIYLHPWTGPLYALPEPTYALLAGHNIAYYASIRP